YVERRLLRRAARFGRELGLEQPFLSKVAPTVAELMGHHYPELIEKRVQIEKIIQTEEERLGSTLARGMNLLDDIFAQMDKDGLKETPGEELFKLHDTYGFPLDLATDIAEDRGYTVDHEGFKKAMTRQKEMARSAWAGSGQDAIAPVYNTVREAQGDTEFLGYTATECPAEIKAIIV
ncbi:MAG: alanine--tRNA ligase, partial [Planctomycetes bacterium]|nr:alanine--tRNA ligase [Planctomycetota bacterium]